MEMRKSVPISGSQLSSIRLATGHFLHTPATSLVPTTATTTTNTTTLASTFRIAPEVREKFLILGSSNVGKTTILCRMQNPNQSQPKVKETTGPDLYRLACGHIEAIDIGGRDSCADISQAYCQLFANFVIVFDITDWQSFLVAKHWLDQLATNESRKILLIGNKKDLHPKRKVCANLARTLALTYAAEYVELSALTDISLDHLVQKFL